jgi:hypothetical protein
MKIKYYEDEKSIGIKLSTKSDKPIFEFIANDLSDSFNTRWISKVDGFDQRYWGFEIRGAILTLHFEHYLGISIFANKSMVNVESAKQVLKEIGDHFKTLSLVA